MMSELVSLTVLDGVAIIQIDNPPVNALSPGVPEGLVRAVASAEADVAAVAIVVIGRGSTFVAGADIATLEQAAWGDTSALPDIHALLAPHRGRHEAGRDGHPRHGARRRTRAGDGGALPRRCARRADWVNPRSTSASFRAPKARSGCRAWSGSRRRSSSL